MIGALTARMRTVVMKRWNMRSMIAAARADSYPSMP